MSTETLSDDPAGVALKDYLRHRPSGRSKPGTAPHPIGGVSTVIYVEHVVRPGSLLVR